MGKVCDLDGDFCSAELGQIPKPLTALSHHLKGEDFFTVGKTQNTIGRISRKRFVRQNLCLLFWFCQNLSSENVRHFLYLLSVFPEYFRCRFGAVSGSALFGSERQTGLFSNTVFVTVVSERAKLVLGKHYQFCTMQMLGGGGCMMLHTPNFNFGYAKTAIG